MPPKRQSLSLYRPGLGFDRPLKRRGFLACLSALILRPKMALARPIQPLVRPSSWFDLLQAVDVPVDYRFVLVDIEPESSPIAVHITVDGRTVYHQIKNPPPERHLMQLPLAATVGKSCRIQIGSRGTFKIYGARFDYDRRESPDCFYGMYASEPALKAASNGDRYPYDPGNEYQFGNHLRYA